MSDCRSCGYDPCSCSSYGGGCLSCGGIPCECSLNINMSCAVNLNPNNCTICTGNTADNIWFEPGPPGFPGKCKLDLMTYEQVYRVLQTVPCAKEHLLRITTDKCLLRLANTTKLIVPPQEDNWHAAKIINDNTLPYYTVLRGNVGGNVNIK